MDWRDLLPDSSEGRVVWRGVISENASDFSSLISVVLPEYDENLQWGPCRWQSRDPVSLPIKGDSCLVIFDNLRQPWIVAWWPF